MIERAAVPWIGGLEIAPGLRLVKVAKEQRRVFIVPAPEPPSIPVSTLQSGCLIALLSPRAGTALPALTRAIIEFGQQIDKVLDVVRILLLSPTAC